MRPEPAGDPVGNSGQLSSDLYMAEGVDQPIWVQVPTSCVIVAPEEVGGAAMTDDVRVCDDHAGRLSHGPDARQWAGNYGGGAMGLGR